MRIINELICAVLCKCDLQLKAEYAEYGSCQTARLAVDDKTKSAMQRQQLEATTTSLTPGLSFAFNVCPPSPESSPTRHHLSGINGSIIGPHRMREMRIIATDDPVV